MVRRGPYHRESGTPTYFSKDNTKLKVIMYLLSRGRANKNKMLNDEKSGLRGQEWNRSTNTLDEMCDLEWIEKNSSEDAEGVTVYSLIEKGKGIANMIKELQTKNHSLLELDSFRGLGLVD